MSSNSFFSLARLNAIFFFVNEAIKMLRDLHFFSLGLDGIVHCIQSRISQVIKKNPVAVKNVNKIKNLTTKTLINFTSLVRTKKNLSQVVNPSSNFLFLIQSNNNNNNNNNYERAICFHFLESECNFMSSQIACAMRESFCVSSNCEIKFLRVFML